MYRSIEKPKKEDLIRLYVDENKSMQECGDILGVCAVTVLNYMRKYGIKSREKHKGFLGKHHTENAKKIISKANKGKVLSEETKNKISESRKLKGVGHKKERTDGYIALYYPEHPYSNQDGYIMEHRHIMEQHIGRYIKDDEVVHHKNKDRKDNRLENLELMTNKEHCRLHMIERHKQRKELADE